MLLNTADKVYAGSLLADAVYLGDTKVWPPAGPPGAEYPSVRSSSVIYDDASPYTFTLPSPIEAGDLILLNLGNGLGSTYTLTGGFTQLAQVTGNSCRAELWGKIASGTEAGTTITATPSSASRTYGAVLVIKDWSGDLTDIATATYQAGSNLRQPDPPALTPPHGAGPYLWVAACGWHDATRTFSAPPANYTDGGGQQAGTTTHGGARIAYRQLTAATENPGAFTLSGNVYCANITAAVKR